ncbi:hypothetical protein BDZ97DRAFT_1763004 [Flammula alnicola]|nr:hypothetical protein BDZ97DRAFT_1763004 [Flammula alnicola]
MPCVPWQAHIPSHTLSLLWVLRHLFRLASPSENPKLKPTSPERGLYGHLPPRLRSAFKIEETERQKDLTMERGDGHELWRNTSTSSRSESFVKQELLFGLQKGLHCLVNSIRGRKFVLRGRTYLGKNGGLAIIPGEEIPASESEHKCKRAAITDLPAPAAPRIQDHVVSLCAYGGAGRSFAYVIPPLAQTPLPPQTNYGEPVWLMKEFFVQHEFGMHTLDDGTAP